MDDNISSAKDPRGAKLALIIGICCLVAAAAIVAVLFLTAKKPLSETAVGKWSVTQDGSSIAAGTEAAMTLSLGIKGDELTKEDAHVRRYLTLKEDGAYSVTIDRDDVIILLNKTLTSVVNYYGDHPTEFLDRIGMGDIYDGDGSDLSAEKIKSYLEEKLKPVREEISKFGMDDYYLDGDGDIIVSEGTYKVTDDRIDFEVTEDRTLVGMYDEEENYITADASSKTLTVRKCAFLAVNVVDGTEMTRVES